MNEFDQKASHWDAKLVRVERAQAMADGIRAALPLSSSMMALEYGCGTGLVSFALQPYLGHITLADSSSGMLAVLREKIAASQVQNMTPRSLDLMIDPLPAERYQVIYTLMTLHHIPDTDRMLRAFYALLDTPGYLCVADLDTEDGTFHEDEFHGHWGFDRAALSAQARQAGFQSIACSTMFQMRKEVAGVPKDYPLFLMIARKS
jgi:ubiquinone/menaquinone biosynthesis C-methylase UbiE